MVLGQSREKNKPPTPHGMLPGLIIAVQKSNARKGKKERPPRQPFGGKGEGKEGKKGGIITSQELGRHNERLNPLMENFKQYQPTTPCSLPVHQR